GADDCLQGSRHSDRARQRDRRPRDRPARAGLTHTAVTRFVGRENVRKRLAPLDGEPGRTTYADGAVRVESAGQEIVVRPAFGLAHTGEYDTVHLGPLFDALAEDHVVAVLLVRLGGYAVGVFEGERLVASKFGPRFFPVPRPRRETLERLPYDLYAAEVVGE